MSRQNIGYGLRLQKMPKAEIDARVGETIALVQLADLADRGIEQLSGGQQQRVALARALVMRPKVLLLDEPLAALDLKLRHAMQEELRRIHQEIGGTFVFVTHDQGEALALANRIAVMREGRLEQVGTAQEIYASPRTRFVSTFIGEANLLPGRRSNGMIRLAAGPQFADAGPDEEISVVVRPENLLALGPEETADVTLDGEIRDIVYLGSHVKYKVAVAGGSDMIVHALPDGSGRATASAERMRIGWQPPASADRQRMIANPSGEYPATRTASWNNRRGNDEHRTISQLPSLSRRTALKAALPPPRRRRGLIPVPGLGRHHRHLPRLAGL